MKTLEKAKKGIFEKWITVFRTKFAKKKEKKNTKKEVRLIKHYYIDEDDTHLFI